MKSLGVMKLPGVEHLETVPLLGEMHVLPLTLRTTAQGVNLPPNPIPLLTHHAIPLFIHIHRAVFHFKISSGACGLPTREYKGESKFGKIGDVLCQLHPEIS